MAVICDADDYTYWERRAVEQICEIHAMKLEGDDAENRVRLAIQLLALSLVKRGQNKKDRPEGSQNPG